MAVRNLSVLVVAGGALCEGGDSRLGRTFWQATDSLLLTSLAPEGSKRVFRRQRPINSNNPDTWFGSHHGASCDHALQVPFDPLRADRHGGAGLPFGITRR